MVIFSVLREQISYIKCIQIILCLTVSIIRDDDDGDNDDGCIYENNDTVVLSYHY